MAKLKKFLTDQKAIKLVRIDATKDIAKDNKTNRTDVRSPKSDLKTKSQETIESVVGFEKSTTVKPASVSKITQIHNGRFLIVVKQLCASGFGWLKITIGNHQAHRPHRSFRHTPRKIHQRPLQIEGYFRFSWLVLGQIWRERKFFASLIITLLVMGVLLTGIVSQDHYNNLKGALNQTYQGGDGLGDKVFKTSLLLISTASGGGFNPVDTEGRQLLSGLLFMIAWLVTVWYLRKRLTGQRVGFRDSLYNACGPMVATILIGVYMLLQLIPLLFFVIFYAAALNTNYVTQGVAAMVLYAVMVLIISLTIYWLEGSFLALIIVTVPKVYPLQAIKIAGDLAIGRRLKILYRLLWHLLQILGLWVVTALPMALLHGWISERWQWLKTVPVVPAMVTLLSVSSVIWTYVYVYFLYRRIVEDESQPA